MRWILLLALAVLPAAAACSASNHSRCRRVCRREAECAEQEQVEYDRSECLEFCLTLDRDPRSEPAVERHTRCVDRATSCDAVLRCQ